MEYMHMMKLNSMNNWKNIQHQLYNWQTLMSDQNRVNKKWAHKCYIGWWWKIRLLFIYRNIIYNYHTRFMVSWWGRDSYLNNELIQISGFVLMNW